MTARKKKSWFVLASFFISLFILGWAGDGFSRDTQPSASLEQVERVSINHSFLEELQLVKGVGPVIAQRIIDFRAENGSFKSLEDLVQVKGIGKAKYEKMKEHLIL